MVGGGRWAVGSGQWAVGWRLCNEREEGVVEIEWGGRRLFGVWSLGVFVWCRHVVNGRSRSSGFIY